MGKTRSVALSGRYGRNVRFGGGLTGGKPLRKQGWLFDWGRLIDFTP